MPRCTSLYAFSLLFCLLAGSVQAGSGTVDDLEPEQKAFWNQLASLCDRAFAGRVDDVTEFYRNALVGRELVAHGVSCSDERIHVALHVDDNRSRNWILTVVDGTIRLKHDHRYPDGTEEEISQYGGDAPPPGLPHRQIFPADAHTAEILPKRADNFWFMDFVDDETFQYGVHWPKYGHSVRLSFDLSTPIEAPSLPWGYE
ncbi:hypothetical protein IC757_10785 [Wenzhouxiangella sp. AB-CW3]|uniref:hypothetical protein n=1 Tax=Wenzhouxiangella sp. AB-CW3 TaxID=2771012 RepID=UPI00168BC00C|nr:hypothetical protein [Wenzhouxiangella sp. AB-CW3]QOC21529.1 hypothetical protein IC757_10785 [Wenzhouxiangella sp. AB-CW3]